MNKKTLKKEIIDRGVRWENQTPESLERLKKLSGGVCLLPIGCIEPHREHLPLGIDALRSHALCERAAKLQPAVVFPPVFLGTIPEGRYLFGTIAIPAQLSLELLIATADEIARNGFKKIIILNGHGGHKGLLGFWFNRHHESGRKYSLYLLGAQTSPGMKEKIYTSKNWEHACEHETSVALELCPELVDLSKVPPKPSFDHKRMNTFKKITIPYEWYTRHPDYYSGDARFATPEKGRIVTEDMVKNIAAKIKLVSKDKLQPKLQKEFHNKVQKVGK
jgi:creatinine amidohydrolase